MADVDTVKDKIEKIVNDILKDVGSKLVDKQSIAEIIKAISASLPYTGTGEFRFDVGPDGCSIVPADLWTTLACLGKPVYLYDNTLAHWVDDSGRYEWDAMLKQALFMPTAPADYIEIKFTVHKDGHVIEGSMKEEKL